MMQRGIRRVRAERAELTASCAYLRKRVWRWGSPFISCMSGTSTPCELGVAEAPTPERSQVEASQSTPCLRNPGAACTASLGNCTSDGTTAANTSSFFAPAVGVGDPESAEGDCSGTEEESHEGKAGG